MRQTEAASGCKAVSNPSTIFSILVNHPKTSCNEMSNFASKIKNLQLKNSSIMVELDCLREQNTPGTQQRANMQKKNLQEFATRSVHCSNTQTDQLQQQNVKPSSKVRQLKRRMGHYNRGLKKIIFGVSETGLGSANLTAMTRKRKVTLDQWRVA